MNLLGVSLSRSPNFKGSILWQSFPVVTLWSDWRKAYFLPWFSLLSWQTSAAFLCQVSLRTTRTRPHFLFAVQTDKDCSPSTSYYSPQQLSVETFYSFHRNLYPTPTLHEIYSEIHYYFFLFVNLSQGQFLKIYTISNCLCCVSL